MKKHSLLKVMLCSLLLVLVLSYLIPGRTGAVSYIGLGDLFINSSQAFYYFYDLLIFIILIGGLYGVLNKTDNYKKLIDTIVTKFKDKSKYFLIAVIAVFAITSALTGITLPLLVFVPFVISIILLMGYDKLVAISSTVGAILVGTVGGIFTTYRDYSSTYHLATLEETLNLEKLSNGIVKLILLVAASALLIYYIFKYVKDKKAKKVKYEIKDDTDIMITEIKGNYKNIKLWPLIAVFACMFVLVVLGLTPWNSLFGITCFDQFHEWLLGLKIGEFSIFGNIISSQFQAFGMWGYLGSFMAINILILVMIIIVKFLCKIKFNDVIEAFVEGAKKVFGTALLVTFAYAILISVYNNGLFEQVITWTVELTNGFNLITATIISLIGSFLHVDFFYSVQGVFLPLSAAIEDTSVYPTLCVLFQSMYGVASFVAPTSLALIFGLTYLKVPFGTWLKYILKFVLLLLLVCLLVSMILLLI